MPIYWTNENDGLTLPYCGSAPHDKGIETRMVQLRRLVRAEGLARLRRMAGQTIWIPKGDGWRSVRIVSPLDVEALPDGWYQICCDISFDPPEDAAIPAPHLAWDFIKARAAAPAPTQPVPLNLAETHFAPCQPTLANESPPPHSC
jgi:hypothetical protein